MPLPKLGYEDSIQVPPCHLGDLDWELLGVSRCVALAASFPRRGSRALDKPPHRSLFSLLALRYPDSNWNRPGNNRVPYQLGHTSMCKSPHGDYTPNGSPAPVTGVLPSALTAGGAFIQRPCVCVEVPGFEPGSSLVPRAAFVNESLPDHPQSTQSRIRTSSLRGQNPACCLVTPTGYVGPTRTRPRKVGPSVHDGRSLQGRRR